VIIRYSSYSYEVRRMWLILEVAGVCGGIRPYREI